MLLHFGISLARVECVVVAVVFKLHVTADILIYGRHSPTRKRTAVGVELGRGVGSAVGNGLGSGVGSALGT